VPLIAAWLHILSRLAPIYSAAAPVHPLLLIVTIL